jgi:hypothetical protein
MYNIKVCEALKQKIFSLFLACEMSSNFVRAGEISSRGRTVGNLSTK